MSEWIVLNQSNKSKSSYDKVNSYLWWNTGWGLLWTIMWASVPDTNRKKRVCCNGKKNKEIMGSFFPQSTVQMLNPKGWMSSQRHKQRATFKDEPKKEAFIVGNLGWAWNAAQDWLKRMEMVQS